jgi:RecQ family ATP-dependent DNA helicase
MVYLVRIIMNESNDYIDKVNDYNRLLKENFGYDKLKNKQAEIIYNVIEKKRDVCGILTTGFGKSICYQLPLLIKKKSVLVVSPLIALMEDQKNSLEKKKIPVCCFNGNNWNKDKDKREILAGNHKIIYTTPEYLVTDSAQSFLKKLVEKDGLVLFAIDESHCISTWGHNFREEYLELSVIRKKYPNIPMVALTATATQNVESDISHYLEMENPLIIKSSFDRPNLYISLKPKTKSIIGDLKPLIEKYKDDFIIIYCKKREDTEKIRDILRDEMGSRVKAYHAGLSADRRTKVQKMFIDGRYKIIVSTIAFGMGIDQTIRCVIHYGVSKSIESYYQEIGRAGRDGLDSECHLFYSHRDFIIYKHFLKDINDPILRKRREKQIKQVEQYIYLRTCRRKYILEYFGEYSNKMNCSNCDNCIRDIPKEDFTFQAFMLFRLLRKTKCKFGSGTIIGTLRGSKAKRISGPLRKLDLWGKGYQWSEDWWKAFIRLLITHSYLRNKPIQGSFGSTLEYTVKGKEWYKKLSKIKILNQSSSLDNSIDEKFRLILNLSDELEKLTIPKKPKHIEIPTIDFNNPNDLDMLVNEQINDSEEATIKIDTNNSEIKKLSITKRKSYFLYHYNKLSIDKISKERNYKKQTIEDHIVDSYKLNLPLNLKPLGYNKDLFNILKEVINSKEINKNINKLRPIKDLMPKKTTYLQIKLGLVDLARN